MFDNYTEPDLLPAQKGRDMCTKTRGTFLRILLLLAWGMAFAQAPDVPDTIFVNGRIFTATNARPYAEAIAVKGSRILAVDTNQQISAMARPNTRRIDVGGRLVIPGINDAHVHFDEGPLGISVDFGDSAPSCAQVFDRLEKAVRKAPPGSLLTGAIDPTAFFDPACVPSTLDRIAPEDAVVLWTPSLHAAMLNQAATRKFSVRMSDPPVLGGWFGKDMKAERWDGVVHEYAWFRIFQMLPSDRGTEQARLQRFLNREAQWGVTSITLIESKPRRRVEMLSSVNSGLRVRVVPSPLTEGNRRLKPEYPAVPQRISDRVSVTGVKWWLDGSPFERSCAMRAPYTDDPSTSGQINFSPGEMRAILVEAQQRNTQLILHTVGDRTAETLLSAIEATGGADAWRRQRLRIEHGDGLTPDLVPRARKLGVIVVQNPTHLQIGELAVQRFGANRAAMQRPLRSLLAAGIPIVLASDGAAGEPELNPYLNIMLASGYPGKPAESLTREQAVIAYTRTAAYAEFAEKDKGTLEAGNFADFAVLSQDIFKIPPQQIPKTESLLTVVGGAVVYNAGIVSVK